MSIITPTMLNITTPTVKIGTTSSATIQSNASLLNINASAIKIGNAVSAKLQSDTTLNVNIPDMIIRSGSSQTLGFKFSVLSLLNIVNPPPFLGGSSAQSSLPPTAVMQLAGLTAGLADIGSSSIPMRHTYSQYIYTTGGAVGTLSTSDIRLKKNITKLPSIQNKIAALNVVKYDFVKTLGSKDVSDDPSYKNKVGLLAQEVMDVFPDIVYYSYDDSAY
ncbi:MAG: tail fiber domain-containing protein, partial [Bacteroidales bacterium]|nr:tail fiber domain-containing protein [Bacteroidales bacterium]